MGPVKRSKSKAPKPARGRVIRYLPAALAFAYFAFVAVLPVVTTRWLDFPVYWEAGQKAAHGQTVYDVAGHFQYKYSPLIALLFGKLFQAVSFHTASVIFQKTMLVLWVTLFLRFARRDFRVVLVAILFFGNAFRLDLELGQINALVLFLLAVLFGALERRSNWREDLRFGALFSFAVQLKLFSIVLVPLLILRREWRKLGLGFLLLPIFSIGGVAIANGWSFAISENRAWFASLTHSTDGLLLSEQNVGVIGTFGKVLGLEAAKGIWIALGIVFAVYLWKNRSRPVDWLRDWLLYAIAIFNPLVWSYWILYALPIFSSRLPDFEGAFRRRSNLAQYFGGIAIFIFAAFNGQNARWAWNGGILLALLFLGLAVSRTRARE